jgi:integrase
VAINDALFLELADSCLPTLDRSRMVRIFRRLRIPGFRDGNRLHCPYFSSDGHFALQGLRSMEVLALNRDDLLLQEGQIRVRGKGGKIRFLPLAPEAIQLLDHYLRVERPQNSAAALFVSLKGRSRGTRMTAAGLRSLFRYHRQTTGVTLANPHRFRHTFASDMVRAGVSLPALMQLMGHADIETTLVYVQVTPLEVYQQYGRAVAQQLRPIPVLSS